MKQVLQNLSNGETSLVEVPCPANTSKTVLIATTNTIVSAGTERMLVEFGKANYIDKARQQPDKVKMVLNKVSTDGLMPTIDAIRSKLDQPLPLGYCNAGYVLAAGSSEFQIGDRVISNGPHAEVVRVPKNLCAKIPDSVDDESAAFTVLGAIGLQGIRLLNPTLGECIVVTGLGLIGLLCVQILRANGCKVLGIDFDSKKCALAKQFGAEVVDLSRKEDPLVASLTFSNGQGVDGVLVTAATKSDEVMHQAAEMCRKRGRIVLVGVVGLNLRRDDFFKKELSFQVSASYGPGRYDPAYEELGNDYPIGFVRWTEQRNFEAVLDMMASGALDVQSLVTHRLSIDSAIQAYGLLDDPTALGIVLQFPKRSEFELRRARVELGPLPAELPGLKIAENSLPTIGFIGAGNYASRVLIPAFKKAQASLDTLVTSGGVSGVHFGKKNEFRVASTDAQDIWQNDSIDTVAIVTRHDAHAIQVVDALNAGKHVFVEKPLALTLAELEQIELAYRAINQSSKTSLMVGFNRRFAPHTVKMKGLLSSLASPKAIIITVNAGEIPSDHWVQDPKVGGGRIIGEGCHFIDLMRHLVGCPIDSFHATKIEIKNGTQAQDDISTITLTFADGSSGTIHYLANGSPTFPKERIEVFCENKVLQLDNFRVLRGYGFKGFKKMKLVKQDKGQKACVQAFINSIAGGSEAPISYDEVMESSRVAIEVAESIR